MSASALESLHVGPTIPHSQYLGASDVGALFGLSQYRTALDVWAEKMGRAPPRSNVRTQSGNDFEPVIRERYAATWGAVLTFPGTLRHGVTGATPDAVANGARDVQMKFVGFEQSRHWGPPDLGADALPAEVLAQVHFEHWHLMYVLGVRDDVAHVVAQVGTDTRLYETPIDEEFSEYLVEGARKWWRDHVVADRMPVVTERDANLLRHMYRDHRNTALEPMSDELAQIVRAYHAEQQAEARARKAKEAFAVQLMEAIRDGHGFSAPGLKVTWRPQRGRIDWEQYARSLGATDATAEQYRAAASRVIDVRAKGDKNE
jgi:predicted phage-related endonuclease